MLTDFQTVVIRHYLQSAELRKLVFDAKFFGLQNVHNGSNYTCRK